MEIRGKDVLEPEGCNVGTEGTSGGSISVLERGVLGSQQASVAVTIRPLLLSLQRHQMPSRCFWIYIPINFRQCGQWQETLPVVA